MNDSNSTNDSTCAYFDWYLQTSANVFFIVYSVLSPIYIIIVLFYRILYLKAFHTKSKVESAYMYQIFTTTSELLQVLSWLVYVTTFQLVTAPGYHGPIWYRSCYICMQISSIFGTTLINVFLTVTELFTIWMSIDRAYALWKPFRYQKFNSKRNITLSAVVCVSVGISTSIFQFFDFVVDIDPIETVEGHLVYQIIQIEPTLLIQVLSTIRSILQIVGFVLLYFFNAALLWLYRNRVIANRKILNSTYQQKKEYEAERVLALLSICQCFWTTLSMCNNIILYAIVFFFPDFPFCSGLLYIPVADGLLCLTDLFDLLSLTLISKQVRRMLLDELPCWKNSTTTVQLFNSQSGSQNKPSGVRNTRQK